MQLCVGFWVASLNRSWVEPRDLYGCLHVPICRCDRDAIWQQPGLMELRMVCGKTARPPCRIHGAARCPAGIIDSHLWTHWDLSPGPSACEEGRHGHHAAFTVRHAALLVSLIRICGHTMPSGSSRA